METGLKFDEAFTRLSNFSTYQFRVCTILLFPILQYSILFAGLPFFIQLPSINCLKSSQLQSCSESEICTTNAKYIFDYTNFRSIIHEWNLICDSNSIIFYVAGAFVVALLIGTILMSFLSERLGRLNMLRWSIGLTAVSEFCIIGSADIYYFIVFLTLLSLTLPGTFLSATSYLWEVTAGYSRTVALTYLLSCVFLGYIPAYYLIFAMGSWRPIVLASLCSGSIGLVFSFRLVESPRFLAIIRGRYSKARSAFEYIAKVNKAQMFEDHLEGEILNEYSETIRKRQGGDISALENSELPEMSDQRDNIAVPYEYLGGAVDAVDREKDLDRGQRFGFRDLFREDLRKSVSVMIVVWGAVGTAGYAFVHSGVVDENVKSNGGILVTIGVFGTVTAGGFAYLIRSKRLLGVFLLAAGGFVVIWGALLMKGMSFVGVYVVGVFLLAGLNLAAMQYSLELLPTPCRCIGIGVFQFWTGVGMVGGGFIVSSDSVEAAGIVAGGILLVLMVIPLFKLQETGETLLKDFVNHS